MAGMRPTGVGPAGSPAGPLGPTSPEFPPPGPNAQGFLGDIYAPRGEIPKMDFSNVQLKTIHDLKVFGDMA